MVPLTIKLLKFIVPVKPSPLRSPGAETETIFSTFPKSIPSNPANDDPVNPVGIAIRGVALVCTATNRKSRNARF